MSTNSFGGKTIESVSCAHLFNGAVTATSGFGNESLECGPSSTVLAGVSFDPTPK